MDLQKIINTASDPEAAQSHDVDLLAQSETEGKKNIEEQIQSIK